MQRFLFFFGGGGHVVRIVFADLDGSSGLYRGIDRKKNDQQGSISMLISIRLRTQTSERGRVFKGMRKKQHTRGNLSAKYDMVAAFTATFPSIAEPRSPA